MKLADGIYTVTALLSPRECDDFIALGESIGYQKATIATVDGSAELHPEVRNNSRIILDSAEVASDLWKKVSPHIPLMLNGRQAIGLNERIRFYRYEHGQQFIGHVDAPFRRVTGELSQLTFMIYPNDDFEGGETRFDEVIVAPQRGMALIFEHELFHEGAVVRNGRKYVLRTDVMYNPVGKFSSSV